MKDFLTRIIAALEGRKSYLAAVGLVLLGLVQIAYGDMANGAATIAQGFTVVGLRFTIAKAA